MKLSVIIPSKTAGNLIQCIGAVKRSSPEFPASQIIVVDDGINWASLGSSEEADWCRQAQLLLGVKPFVFARNINKGLRIAAELGNHALLLNDDALIETPNALATLVDYMDNSTFGILSPSVDVTGNFNQRNRSSFGVIRPEGRMLCFMSVLIRNKLFAPGGPVGLMDERYVDYGMDDDDYCREVMRAGFPLGVVDDVKVNHSKLESSFRGHGAGDFSANMRRYIQKWGTDNWGQGKATSKFAHLWPEN